MHNSYWGHLFISQIPLPSPEILSQQLGVGPRTLPISQVPLESWCRRFWNPPKEIWPKTLQMAEEDKTRQCVLQGRDLEGNGVFWEFGSLASSCVSFKVLGESRNERWNTNSGFHTQYVKIIFLQLNIWGNCDRVKKKFAWGVRRRDSAYIMGPASMPCGTGTHSRRDTARGSCCLCCLILKVVGTVREKKKRKGAMHWWGWKAFNVF